MNIRRATTADARRIAAIVLEHASTIMVFPEEAGPFWASMNEEAHRQNIESERFEYFVAEEADIQGYIALRDGSHLFNFFVTKERVGQGIGGLLWQHLTAILQGRHVEAVTVNASKNAIYIYEALGFASSAEPCVAHGVAFTPMVFRLRNAA